VCKVSLKSKLSRLRLNGSSRKVNHLACSITHSTPSLSRVCVYVCVLVPLWQCDNWQTTHHSVTTSVRHRQACKLQLTHTSLSSSSSYHQQQQQQQHHVHYLQFVLSFHSLGAPVSYKKRNDTQHITTERHQSCKGSMVSAVALACSGNLGVVPPAGSRGRAPGQRTRG